MDTQTKTNIIIDFDSTFMQVEALEELADIILKSSPNRKEIVDQIKAITDLGVDGKITFNESLSRRLALIRVHENHLVKLVKRLKKKVSVSFSRNRKFFKKYKGRIFIISNGFKDFIDPVVADYGIDEDRVLGNTFTFDDEGWVTGYDKNNLLAYSKGKSKRLKSLNLDGEIVVIGDAYTDFEMVEAGIAHKFFMFTENVFRESILDKADHVTPSFDEFLYVHNMQGALSYPKSRLKALLLDDINGIAHKAFETEGYQVESINGNLTEQELCEKIADVSILGIDARTVVSEKLLDHGKRLMAIGSFSARTHFIDTAACASKGIIVFNAPYTNLRSQVELVVGQIIMLMRRIPAYNRKMHAGKWASLPTDTFEIRGKRLGIVGYGNAGQQLSVLAEAMGMEVFYYDLLEKPALGNAKKCITLKELLRKSDVVSLHVDARPENKKFFDKSAFKAMRRNSILINLSNGTAVDEKALVSNLKSGKLLGAGVDVFSKEPSEEESHFQSKLQGFENVILTPHINGSTVEAKEDTAHFVPMQIIDYINSGITSGSVNFPKLQLPTLKNAHRLIHIHENRPGLLAKINSVLAEHNINILGQYLKTNNEIGYVITDINKKYGKEVLKDLKKIDRTIKFRTLY